MKKLVSSLVLLLIVLTTVVSAYAVGIDIMSQEGDRVGILEDITVREATSGNAVVILGDIVIENDVDGDVVAVLGDVTINAGVSGEVVSVLGRVRLNDGAVVKGDIVSIGSVDKSPGAKVFGEEVKIQAGEFDTGFIFVVIVVSTIAFTFVAIAVGLIFITIFKDKRPWVFSRIENNTGRKIATGFLVYLVITIVLLILFITVIAPVVYLVLLIASTVAASIYFGRVLLRTFGSNGNIYLDFITGLVTITLIKVLLVYLIPHYNVVLGGTIYMVFSVLVNSLGLGIIVDSKIYKNNTKIEN